MTIDPEAKAQSAVNALVQNGRSSREFITALAAEHRTNQQAVTGVMIDWLRHLASLSDFQYDARNEASVERAKVIVQALEAAGFTQRMPII